MAHVLSALLIIIFIIFVFVPLASMNDNHMEVQTVKQNLNLAARAVCSSIENSLGNYENLSEGYERKPYSEILIDKEKLLREFYDVLEKNYYSEAAFNKIKERICLKAVVYNDRFYISGRNDKWSAPYFFHTYRSAPINDIVTVSTFSDEAWLYENSQKTYKPISSPDINITSEQKNDIIIDRLNSVISQNTYSPTEKVSLEIKIKNPEETDTDYKMKYGHFNVLKGITFFVLYAEDDSIFVNSKNYKFKNYNVTGYTLEHGSWE